MTAAKAAKKRILSSSGTAALLLLLSLAVYFSPGNRKYYNGDEYHTEQNYEDIEIVWVDEDAVLQNLDDYERAIESGNEDAILSGYDRCAEDFNAIWTERNLTDIRSNCEIGNETYEDLELHMVEFTSGEKNRFFALTRDALKTPAGEALSSHIGDEWAESQFLNFKEDSEEELALDLEYEELNQEYERLSNETATIIIDGAEWDLGKLGTDKTLPYPDQMKIYAALLQKRNAVLAPIYVDMVHVLNRKAQLHGYDNYADYAYKEIYERDYTTAEIQTVYDGVSKSIVPLHCELVEKIDDEVLYDLCPDEGEVLAAIDPVIEKIHPDLRQAWDYLLKHHFYDIAPSPDKLYGAGFTAQLYSYGTPFVFYSPQGNWRDIDTVIHEFGHYNEGFHGKSNIIGEHDNMDVSEIHSQGLELLSLACADELYGKENGYQAGLSVLYEKTCSILDGCIYDEFQYRSFTCDGDLTVDELNHLSAELFQSYYPEDPYGIYAYWWTETPHLFNMPMYYISYTTSGLAAFDLLAVSTEDRNAAIDCYMNLTTHHGEEGFRETLHAVGLPDIFEDGVIENIAEEIRSGF